MRAIKPAHEKKSKLAPIPPAPPTPQPIPPTPPEPPTVPTPEELPLGNLTITVTSHGNDSAEAKFDLPDGSTVTREIPATGLAMKLGLGLGLRYVKGAAAAYAGPLDIMSGALAAYSVARALSAARIGQNVIKLRRGSDDATLDFVAGMDGSVSVAAVTAWLGGASGFFHTIYDQSGNGKNWVQATAARQPEWRAALNSTKPSALFVPANADLMATADAVTFDSPSATFLMVMRPTPFVGAGTYQISGSGWATSSGGMKITWSADGAVNLGMAVAFESDAPANGAAWNAVTTPFNNGDVLVLDFTVDGTNAPYTGALSINGTNIAVTDGGDAGFGSLSWPLAIGDNDSTRVTASLDAQVFEYIVYPVEMSNPTRASVDANIATYYGVTLS